ncbi:MAG: hypothetical protein IPJ07_03540 [Acidobacteria bacterium]|nr:hypothetical protein [Acidobacteriota bacterium]
MWRSRIHSLIAIGAPARFIDKDLLRECGKPILFIHGAEDDIAPLEPLKNTLETLPLSADQRLVVIEGAGHFFDDHSKELIEAIKAFVAV